MGLWYQKNVIKDLRSTIRNQDQKLVMLSDQVNGRISTFSEDLDVLKKQQQWIINENYKFLSYNAKNGEIDLSFTWTLKDAPSNSKVFLSYGELNGTSSENTTWNKVAATDDGSLNYSADVILSKDKNYIFKVISEGSSGIKSDTLLTLPLMDVYYNRLFLFGQVKREDNPRLNHHIYLVNNNKNIDFLNVKSAVAEVYVKGALQNTVELYKGSKNETIKGIPSSIWSRPDQELWFNDDAIWVNGEDKWIQNKDKTWTNGGNVPDVYSGEVKIKVIVIDNLGETHTLNFPRLD